jgi:putative ABC transport system substrate-binding protein
LLVLSGQRSPAQRGKIPVLGVLTLGTPPPDAFLKSLRAGLQHAGYGEDRNIRLDIRIADGTAERVTQQAQELVAAKVDVIVAYQTQAAEAAKQATRDIPIVIAGVGDPVGTGLVASYAKPGGNITGTTSGAVEVAGKTVELIPELLPSARRFAALVSNTNPFTKPFLAEVSRVAQIVNLHVEPVEAHTTDPLDGAFDRIVRSRAEAVIIQGSMAGKEAVDLANRHRLPSIGSARTLPKLGGLMSYSGDFDAMLRETATYVDKILKGAMPADLPVTFPSAFEMVLNLKTAKSLGLSISETFLQRANEVIE